MPPTTFNTGDIAITGYITNGTPDSFSFVNLVPIGAGTVLYFTDNGWTGTGFRGVTAGDADGNENLIRFTANADIPAGTVIRSIDTSASYTWTKSGSVAPPASGAYLDIALNQGGDQIAAVQSTGTSPLLTGFTPVYQIDYTGAFENAIDSGSGNVIPGLSQAGNTATLFSSSGTSAAFNLSTLTNGTRDQWLAAINNSSNWTFGSATALPTGSITVGGGIPTASLSVSSNSGSEAGTTVVTVTATASSAVSGDQTLSLGVSGTGITLGDYALSAGTITIPGGTTTGSVTFTVVDDAIAEGAETAVLTISNPSSGVGLGSITTQSISLLDNDLPADLTISQADSPDPVLVGNPLTYTLTVGNTGGASATGVTVQYTLPSGATFNGTTVANGFTASQSAGVVTFTGGSINAGGDATLTVSVLPNASGTLTSGTAVVDPANAIAESNEANNTAGSITTTVAQGNANLVTTVAITGNTTDLASGSGANANRLGGFGSDFFYDYRNNVYYGLADRGPGGGVISYETRVDQFSIDIDPATGAINSYQLLQTIPFVIPAGTTLNGITYTTDTPFNGLNATLLNGNGGILGQSQDPEGFVVGANGNFFVSDEYGPSVYEFSPTGRFVRAFTQPSNVLPQVNGSPNYAGDVTSTTGRQDNRGYEGLAISPDGTKLFAVFQDPLQQEGTPTGRNSRNVRIVRFDIATGLSDAQYIYQLESLADINNRLPGTANDFGATSQGRNIGISSIVSLNNNELLVVERDNRGFGVADPLAATIVGSKQVFKINLTGATDVSNISLAGTNTLPVGVTPVGKSLFLDLASAIQGAGQLVPEKIEGLAIGPQLTDGSFALVVATDNDFSVTQDAGNIQFDVYTNGISTVQVPLDSAPPAAPTGEPAYALIPSYLYSFKTQPTSLDVTPLFDFDVANYTTPEGNTSGFTTNATVRVTRRGNLANTDTVQLQLNNGTATGGATATAGVDYNNAVISVTFNPNETFKDVVIPVAGDTTFESNETVNLALANPGAGTLVGTSQPTAVLTVQNDDIDSTVKIHQIQGSGTTFNPAFGGTQTIEGIVVGAFSGTSQLRGFYLQEEDADADANPTTSEGIFVFDPSGLFSGAVGTKVRVTGTVSDFSTSASNIVGTGSSSLTQITSTSVVNLGTATLPAVTNVVLPVTDASVLERYEGMLVNASAATGSLTVTETFKLGRFGQVGLSTGGRIDQYTQNNLPSTSGNSNYLANLLDRYIILDDGSTTQNPDPTIFARGGQPLSATNTLRGGDTVDSITGVLDERFEGYRIQTRTPVNFQPTNPRPATAPNVGGSLKVASFNVLNYFTNLDTNTVISIPNGVSFEPRGANTAAEFTRQRDKIVSAITTLDTDVLGVIEMENDGPTSIQNLVNGLNAVAGAGTYAFISDTALVNDPNPAINAVGTDAIKVGIIYKPGSVTPVGSPLTYLEPNPADPIFNRPPIAQTFADGNGNQFTVIVNHFKSKTPTGAAGADLDQGDGQGAFNATRVAQSQALLSFIDTVKAASGDDDVLVIGDLNAYALEDPITTLTNGGLTNLVDNSAYSFQFNGQWGTLDYALASASLESQVTGAAEFPINSDEPVVLDYNTEFKSAGQVSGFYNPGPFRSSDHDPVVIGLDLGSAINVIDGTSDRDDLTGLATVGRDQITGKGSGDILAGDLGNDQFVYTSFRDSGDRIVDFTVGEDQIVLTQLLASIGYSGTDAIADGYLQVTATGSSNTFSVDIDADGFGAGNDFAPFIVVQGPGLTVASLNSATNFVF
jgi:uncharacterized repeat protein (TIGR01451 family)